MTHKTYTEDIELIGGPSDGTLFRISMPLELIELCEAGAVHQWQRDKMSNKARSGCTKFWYRGWRKT